MRSHHVRRLTLALVLSACSSPKTEPRVEPTETPGLVSVAPGDDAAAHADTANAVAVAENPPPTFGAPVAAIGKPDVFQPRRLSSGRHGTRIVTVEVSADGAGAVSRDVETHARLWPALDGSREPLALPLISPSEIALHHDADGFAVASLDTGGGIAILDIDNTDMLVHHVALAAEPAYADVLATGSGFLALRKDHQIDWIDRTGARGASLVPPHGERVAGLLAAAGRVLALVETREGLHGQWIEASAGKLAWGATTPLLDLEPEHAFLSPDGTRIVAMRPRKKGPAVFELATGAAKAMKWRDPKAPPSFELEVPPPTPQFVPHPPGKLLGWATNDRIVFSDLFEGGGPFGWYDVRGMLVTQMSDDLAFMFASEQTVLGGGKAVSFLDRELAIVSPAKVEYLGYRTRSARGVRLTPAGMVARFGSTVALDDRLRAGKRVVDAGTVKVGDDLALVGFAEPQMIDTAWLEKTEPRPRARLTRVALYDTANKKELQSWPVASTGERPAYEPVTKRMVIAHSKALEVATFDPAARAFGPSTKIAVPPPSEVVLLDPAVAGGEVAITLHDRGKELRRWRAGDLEQGVAPEPTAIAARPEAIDRAGHVYVRESPDTVVVSGRGREVRLTDMKSWTLRPNADGTRIAAFRASGVILFDDSGRTLWTIGMPGVTDLVWDADGTLLAVARDLVELSTQDGSIIYAQCGWSFGKRTTPNEDFIPTDHTYCDR